MIEIAGLGAKGRHETRGGSLAGSLVERCISGEVGLVLLHGVLAVERGRVELGQGRKTGLERLRGGGVAGAGRSRIRDLREVQARLRRFHVCARRDGRHVDLERGWTRSPLQARRDAGVGGFWLACVRGTHGI